MTIISNFVDLPQVQALMPVLFLGLGLVIGIPPLLLHLSLHPFTYFLNPSLSLSRRIALARQKLFFYAWRTMSPLLDPGDRPIKQPLLRRAYGTVLEIGAGVGDNIKYYDRAQVERLVLVEPNTNMHPALRAKANAAGYFDADGSLLLLGCGGAASDERALNRAGLTDGTVDSVVAIHVLCGIPAPAAAIEMYRRLLKPGGLLVFYEHVRSSQRYTADWQRWYTDLIWPYAFDGCCLDRPTGAWIVGGEEAAKGKALANGTELVNGVGGMEEDVRRRWRDVKIVEPEGQKRYATTPHVLGWAVKA